MENYKREGAWNGMQRNWETETRKNEELREMENGKKRGKERWGGIQINDMSDTDPLLLLLNV